MPWHDCLSGFSVELATELGELLRRLAPALGRHRDPSHGGELPSQGLDDLRRRGPYERLLASEWLLADEIPDEFLRRAASGEHLFLSPAPNERMADRRIVALFHSGSWQLGAPRLAHLALCILLDRRAKAAGGELRWGSLQAPGEWRQGAEPEALKQLLRARAYRNFDQQLYQEWHQSLSELGAVDECWLIGYPLDKQGLLAPLFTHQADIAPTLRGDALRIAIRDRGGERSLNLPLPSHDAGLALLQGRFQAGQATVRTETQRFSLRHAPLLSPNGRHVAVSLQGGYAALMLPVDKPGQTSKQKTRLLQWHKAGSLLAHAFTSKTLGAVIQRGSQLHFLQFPRIGKAPLPPQAEFHAPPGSSTLLDAAWLTGRSGGWLYLLDGSGNLVYWKNSGKENANAMRHQSAGVLAISQIDAASLLYAKHQDGKLQLRWLNADPGLQTGEAAPGIACQTDSRVLLHSPPQSQRFACAVKIGGGERESWQLHSGNGNGELDSRECELPAGWRAIGVQLTNQARLLLAHAKQSQIALLDGDKILPLHQTASPIARLSYTSSCAGIALLTEQRELLVYSLSERAVVLHLQNQAGENGHD
ncbi:hypothetical protein [Chromobacterium phragmitis]|uniref:Uncharacterized protein n=1 Tax=Chromobacterium phragmitis TaxID=2202141 RepID=A0A344UDX9_9NEIS|nr:hypothetical protein [Chromobacterium phragmitis]AXE33477.1 hypothetical protein DK843_03590 [Chromobacterium phragmitis]